MNKKHEIEFDDFFLPAEWDEHAAVWTAWPYEEEYWLEYLEPAKKQFTEFCRHLSASEPVKILVANQQAATEAAVALAGLNNVTLIPMSYGDIWLRDIAPIFLTSSKGYGAAACFHFNGWGEKYIMPPDDLVSVKIAKLTGKKTFQIPLVLEGGSLDADGEGTALTTCQCLLNKNRNPDLSQEQIEELVKQSLGLSKLLWLTDGLLNDHTDGHIDNIARFVAPAKVVCMKPSGEDDPNAQVYATIASDLREMVDARGRKLEVVEIPSPGMVRDPDGAIIPASYLNFYIGNRVVIVPVYGTPYDQSAVHELAKCFPGRQTIGIRANAIITGGGSFHCITQQEPLV